METASLKKFAQKARSDLLAQVGARLEATLAADSLERRESPRTVADLEKAVRERGKEQVVERVAYTWFNRLCALRFMDLRRYTGIGIVSPAAGQTQPEILAEAKGGEIDEELVQDPKIRQRIQELLAGKYTSHDPQGEAYRLLLVSACNYWNKILPFMFGRINDYTGLLLPLDLLSEKSILAQILAAINAENCKNVEIIGWLYQFYISEKKDVIFASKNCKIPPENIPAATQLFTPHWIVRYLVENSLGRLWLQNRPNSGLAAEMPYYLAPEGPEEDFLQISSPEDIRICDPACGSGHILVYAFDLLHRIYQEQGYPEAEIPGMILQNNLFGIEIDPRAGELAAFALMMKAREKQRSFFAKKISPNILVLENVAFSDKEKKSYMDFVGRDLFTSDLAACMDQFAEADNFGSLIRPTVKNVAQSRAILEKRDVSNNLLVQPIHEKVLKILKMAEYLSPRYHVVIANPPYMGGRGMNARLAEWARENYPDSKSDFFAMFMERGLELLPKHGYCAMVTMQSWMFLSSFENLRSKIFRANAIFSMAHLGARAFDSIGGEVVSTTAFVIGKNANEEFKGDFIRLTDGKSEQEKVEALKEAIRNPACSWFFQASAEDFRKIPGSPIAYWVSGKIRDIFANNKALGEIAEAKVGLQTGDNNLFVRNWHEVDLKKIGFGKTSATGALDSGLKWFSYNKGGEFRKWYGNQEFVVNWENDGEEIKNFKDDRNKLRSRPQNTNFYFKEAVSWSKISSSNLAARFFSNGFIFDVAGCSIFSRNNKSVICFINSLIVRKLLLTLSPTLNFEVGHINCLPINININDININELSSNLISLSKTDWDSYETSWDFTSLPLLSPDFRKDTLEATYAALRDHWRQMTLEMQRLEEENNRIFIKAYGLEDELAPEVPLSEITLTCNPHYRYGGNKTGEELERLLLADTMREFISYAVGCMFGRYALEKPGLVLASQGQTLEDYRALVPDAKFPPDDDNVIPVLDGEWFRDDIVGRFRKFLRLAFGEEHFTENLAFVEKALGKDIRKYFLRDFYGDHWKRYKKRPIYWLFQSPEGDFSALVYMHRYTPETAGIVQASYLRDFIAKLEAEKRSAQATEISGEATAAQKTRAGKKLAALQKTIAGLEEYEREVLYPLATQKLAIDLDDGVRVNYPKFGAALKKIPGLEGGE